MTKNISFICSDKFYNRINNIRHQMIKKGFPEEILTDEYIVKEAIRTLDEKIKYLIYDIELKK